MRNHSVLRFLGLAIVFGLVSANWAFADVYGTIRGVVTDQTGAVIAGATITVTNNSTGIAKRTTTATDGSYEVVQLAAPVQRIDERFQSHVREQARPMGGDLAEEQADHALREVVGLDLVLDGQFPQPRRQVPVAANDTRDQSFMRQVVETARPAVTLAGRVNERQVLRPRFVKKAGLNGGRERLRVGGADEAAHGHRCPVSDRRDRFARLDASGSSHRVTRSTSRR